MLIDKTIYISIGILIGFFIGLFINLKLKHKLKRRVLELEDIMLRDHARILELEKDCKKWNIEETAWLGCGELKNKNSGV